MSSCSLCCPASNAAVKWVSKAGFLSLLLTGGGGHSRGIVGVPSDREYSQFQGSQASPSRGSVGMRTIFPSSTLTVSSSVVLTPTAASASSGSARRLALRDLPLARAAAI